jgi:hypothetical protein
VFNLYSKTIKQRLEGNNYFKFFYFAHHVMGCNDIMQKNWDKVILLFKTNLNKKGKGFWINFTFFAK